MLDIILFIISAIVIFITGTRLSRICDELADQTRLGEAFVGAIFLGATTSLSGITVSVTAAWEGDASLALSNAYGGIAAQTLFIAFADIAYRKVNLEHAAASLENLMTGAVLLLLMSLLVFASARPGLSIWQVHPVSYLLPVIYLFSLHTLRQAHVNPMWLAKKTHSTRLDEPSKKNLKMSRSQQVRRWIGLVLICLIIVAAGWTLTESSQSLAERFGLNASFLGALILAIITSTPELVTTIAAVRQGALTLAVGGILGGNAFDTLFAAMADFAYREGPIYAHVSQKEVGILGIAMGMTGLILWGLLSRQQKGPGGIGFESVAVILLYVIGMALLFI